MNKLHAITGKAVELSVKAGGTGMVNIMTVPQSGNYLVLANPDLDISIDALMVTQFTRNGISAFKSFRQFGDSGGGSTNFIIRDFIAGDTIGMRCVNTSTLDVTFRISAYLIVL